jgi:cation:H+ antiporter
MDEIIHHIIRLNSTFQFIIVLLNIVGLWFGSEKVIKAVQIIARKFNISELLIGLTFVSIGSSLPEIFINISAGLNGVDNVGVGNIIGSCFVQISFILGICVLIGGNMPESRKKLFRDAPILLGSIILLYIFGQNNLISPLEASFMIFVYICYITYLFLHIEKPKHKIKQQKINIWLSIFNFLFGLFIIWLSAELLINIGINAGQKAGIPEGIIGLFSGIGTSIPELSISLIAILKKSNGISVGNLLGSNITDPLLSLSIGAILAGGYTTSNFLLNTAIPAWFIASSFIILNFFLFKKMTRIPAIISIIFYISSFFYFFQ